MVKTANQETPTASLLSRRATLLAGLLPPAHLIRASCVEQYLTCGKQNCRCHKGDKHGPFHYLVQCLGTGSVNKFLLKTAEQRGQAQAATRAYKEFQAQVEELSKINTELLRRGESLRP